MEKIIGKTKLTLVQGDITRQGTEAIVNAANSTLMGGGGVDSAIHRAGGPQILAECKEIVATQGQCPPGEAVITSGGKLPAKYVIHTVGPIWQGGQAGEESLLAAAYENSLHLAHKNNIRSISFPSISTGVYRFPIEKAAKIALGTIINYLNKHPEAFSQISCVLFSAADFQIYKQALSLW